MLLKHTTKDSPSLVPRRHSGTFFQAVARLGRKRYCIAAQARAHFPKLESRVPAFSSLQLSFDMAFFMQQSPGVPANKTSETHIYVQNIKEYSDQPKQSIAGLSDGRFA